MKKVNTRSNDEIYAAHDVLGDHDPASCGACYEEVPTQYIEDVTALTMSRLRMSRQMAIGYLFKAVIGHAVAVVTHEPEKGTEEMDPVLAKIVAGHLAKLRAQKPEQPREH